MYEADLKIVVGIYSHWGHWPEQDYSYSHMFWNIVWVLPHGWGIQCAATLSFNNFSLVKCALNTRSGQTLFKISLGKCDQNQRRVQTIFQVSVNLECIPLKTVFIFLAADTHTG